MPAMAAAILARPASRARYIEKDLTLALARELRDQLVKRGRVRVAMSRDDDRYLDLEERAAVARRLDAAMFVSLHMDSAPNPLARGASVYSLSDVASDAEAARFASIENGGVSAADGNGSAAAMLSDLAMQGQMTASADLAARLVTNPPAGSSFGPNRTASLPSTCFAAPTRLPCCSKPDTSAMPRMSCCCARPSTAPRSRLRSPRRSRPTSRLTAAVNAFQRPAEQARRLFE